MKQIFSKLRAGDLPDFRIQNDSPFTSGEDDFRGLSRRIGGVSFWEVAKFNDVFSDVIIPTYTKIIPL